MTPQTSPRVSGSALDRTIVRLLAPAVLAAALLLSLVSFAGPAEAATTRRTHAELMWGRAVLHALNTERRAHHLPALGMDQRLRLSARWHNLSMASHDSLSHQLPGELDFARRIDKAGYHWRYAGENIGWNSVISERGVVALETLMYGEKAPNDGHRQNILSRYYRNVGVDVYVDRAHHRVWLTTDFGRK